MKAKLIVEGKEFPIEIQDPELEKLLKPHKKTGYERLEENCDYFYEDAEGGSCVAMEMNRDGDNKSYDVANYYSDRTVAENNARADKLMRQLRRFAVEHRENDVDWHSMSKKYYIRFGHGDLSLWAETEIMGQGFGMITFDTKEACELAINTFRKELIWYFTEYKDSL